MQEKHCRNPQPRPGPSPDGIEHPQGATDQERARNPADLAEEPADDAAGQQVDAEQRRDHHVDGTQMDRLAISQATHDHFPDRQLAREIAAVFG